MNIAKAINRAISFPIVVVYFSMVAFVDHEYFRDRDIYATLYANHSNDILFNYNSLALLFNEPLFLIFNLAASSFIGGHEIVQLLVVLVVGFIIFALWEGASSVLALVLCILIFFFSPYLFHFQFVILRQAFATVLFLFALLYLRDGWVKCAVIFMTPFIHSVFFLIILLYFIFAKVVKRKSILYVILVSSAIGVLMSSMFFSFGSYLGFRQLDEYLGALEIDVGGGGFILSMVILLYLYSWVFGRKGLMFAHNRNLSIENGGFFELYMTTVSLIVIYIVTYYTLPIAGRLQSSTFAFVVVLLARRAGLVNLLFLSFLLCVSLYSALSGDIESGSLNITYSHYLSSLFGFYGVFN